MVFTCTHVVRFTASHLLQVTSVPLGVRVCVLNGVGDGGMDV